jgi:hypothetical protein
MVCCIPLCYADTMPFTACMLVMDSVHSIPHTFLPSVPWMATCSIVVLHMWRGILGVGISLIPFLPSVRGWGWQ